MEMYLQFRKRTFILVLLSFAICVTGNVSVFRELRVNINPGCDFEGINCTSWTNISLVHIRSDGHNDSLHFVWSFNGSPSLLLARTPPQTTFSVNWDAFRNNSLNSIKFNGPQPIYTFAYTLNKVWIYNDLDDNVRIDKVNQTNVVGYDTSFFEWERQDFMSILSTSDVELTFISKKYKNHSLGPDGFFSMSIRAKELDGYSEILPYMLHNSNMTQIDIDFGKVQMNYPTENPKNTRVAFTFTLVQGDEEKGSSDDTKMRFDRVATLDDEHTPGVFSTINVRTPIVGSYDQSFLQWKPICYTGKVRDITDSIDVNAYDIQQQQMNFSDMTLKNSLLRAYYGAHLDLLVLQSMNVSFGTKQDKFYNKTPHISWTYMTGFGNPPEDYVSLMVILVVSIGFGIPVLIILVSSAFIIYKRLSKPRDELLIGH